MIDSGRKIKTMNTENEGVLLKKTWVKPEVEVISTDHIQGGSARFYTEGQRSPTFNNNGYS